MKTKPRENRTCDKRTNEPQRAFSKQPHLPESTYDRSAVMKCAWREWRYAVSKGWDKLDDVTFASCLRIAHGMHQAYQRRAIYAAYGLRLVA